MADRFECDGCGQCCRQLIIEIEELDLIREPRLIAASDPIRVPEGMRLVDEDGDPVEETIPGYGAGAVLACGSRRPCPLLGGDNCCGIYPTRPTTCVAFRAGSGQCQEARGMGGLPPLEPVRPGRVALAVVGS